MIAWLTLSVGAIASVVAALCADRLFAWVEDAPARAAMREAHERELDAVAKRVESRLAREWSKRVHDHSNACEICRGVGACYVCDTPPPPPPPRTVHGG